VVRKSRKSGKQLTSLDAKKMLISVGAGIYMLRLELDKLDPNEWYARWKETVNELDNYQFLIGDFIEQFGDILETMEYQLPSFMVAVEVANPLYDPNAKGSKHDDDDPFDGLGDYDPF